MNIAILGQSFTPKRVVVSALAYLVDVLRRLLKDLRRPAEHGDYDAEVTHRVRISTRKAEVAIRLLRRAGVRLAARKLRRRLAALRRACGPLRDADIRWEYLLKVRPSLDPQEWTLLAGAALHAQAEARRDHQDALDRQRRRVRSMIKRVLKRANQQSSELQRVPKPRRLCRWFDRDVTSWLNQPQLLLDVTDLHVMRLRVKKLRYVLDCFLDEDATEFQAALAWLRQWQEALGTIRDCQLHLQWLEQLDQVVTHAPGAASEWPRALVTWRNELTHKIETQIEACARLKADQRALTPATLPGDAEAPPKPPLGPPE